MRGVRAELTCCCGATVETTLRRPFRPIFHGGDSGFGRWELELDVPDGWVAFDPYTNVTYCPTCWADIEAPVAPPSGEPEASDQAVRRASLLPEGTPDGS